MRLLPDGRLDTTFGSGGRAWSDDPDAVTVEPDGKIVVASGPRTSGNHTYDRGIHVVRLDADGHRLMEGRLSEDAPPQSHGVSDVAVQDDGKIVVSGRPTLLRSNANGSIDDGFGANGEVIEAVPVGRLLIQPDGKFLVTGRSADFTVTRYLSDGARAMRPSA